MSKKTTKKKSKWQVWKPRERKFSERNQKLIDELNAKAMDNADSMFRNFSKWCLITYAWIIFLPPYGLYRVWSKESTFRKSEKYCWTMICVVYMLSLIQTVL